MNDAQHYQNQKIRNSSILMQHIGGMMIRNKELEFILEGEMGQ